MTYIMYSWTIIKMHYFSLKNNLSKYRIKVSCCIFCINSIFKKVFKTIIIFFIIILQFFN